MKLGHSASGPSYATESGFVASINLGPCEYSSLVRVFMICDQGRVWGQENTACYSAAGLGVGVSEVPASPYEYGIFDVSWLSAESGLTDPGSQTQACIYRNLNATCMVGYDPADKGNLFQSCLAVCQGCISLCFLSPCGSIPLCYAVS